MNAGGGRCCHTLRRPTEPLAQGWAPGTCGAGGGVRTPGPLLLWDSASRDEGDALATNEYWRPGW